MIAVRAAREPSQTETLGLWIIVSVDVGVVVDFDGDGDGDVNWDDPLRRKHRGYSLENG